MSDREGRVPEALRELLRGLRNDGTNDVAIGALEDDLAIAQPRVIVAPAASSWRVAKCLDQLLAEINASAPNRSKASDGSIGDADHQSRDSDHNPWCCGWVVTARDYTHDPANGFDSYEFADWLRARCAGEILLNGQRETRLKYIISNRRIASAEYGWVWRDYTGSNPHDHHVHVSCDCTGEGGYMDSTASFGWGRKDTDMSIDDIVPATGDRSVGTVLSDVWNAIATGASGYVPDQPLHLNAQLNDIQRQVDALTEAQSDITNALAAVRQKVEELRRGDDDSNGRHHERS